MKTFLILSTILIGMVILFPGCYTQVAVPPESVQYTPSNGSEGDSSYANNDNSAYDNYHDNDEWDHAHVGYSYYYPSYWPSDYYAAAYASPWSFSVGFGYGYGGYYGGYGGYYGGYGGYYPYYPYYPYDPYYCGYYPYYYSQSIRNYGMTRTGAPVRGSVYGGRSTVPTTVGGATTDILGRLPAGSALQGGSSQIQKRSSSINAVPRTQGSGRVGRSTQAQNSKTTPQRYQDGRTGSRGSMGRTPNPSGTQQAAPTPKAPGTPSAAPSGRSSRGNRPTSTFRQPSRYNGGSTRSSAPSPSWGGVRGGSSPAPSMGGGHSAPAPSRGGGGGGRRP